MQNKFKLDEYYKQLQKIQKTFNQTPNLKHKTYLKNKSQFSIKTIKNDSYLKKDPQNYKNLKTSLQKHKKTTNSQQKHNPKDIPLKYLQDIQQSFISKNGPQNSILTQQENQKIVLQIYGFDSKQEDQQITVKNNNKNKSNSNKKTTEYQKQEKQQIIENKIQNKSINTQNITQKIIQNLKQRNIIYQKIKKQCKNHNNLDIQFQKMWTKYHLYQQFINNLSQLKNIQ